MIYGGPGFLTFVYLAPLSSPPPPPLSRQQAKRATHKKKDHLLIEGWVRSKSYDSEKAWFSISHSILSDDMNRSFSVQNKERGMILLENLLKREKPCFLVNKREVSYNAAQDLTRPFL